MLAVCAQVQKQEAMQLWKPVADLGRPKRTQKLVLIYHATSDARLSHRISIRFLSASCVSLQAFQRFRAPNGQARHPSRASVNTFSGLTNIPCRRPRIWPNGRCCCSCSDYHGTVFSDGFFVWRYVHLPETARQGFCSNHVRQIARAGKPADQ